MTRGGVTPPRRLRLGTRSVGLVVLVAVGCPAAAGATPGSLADERAGSAALLAPTPTAFAATSDGWLALPATPALAERHTVDPATLVGLPDVPDPAATVIDAVRGNVVGDAADELVVVFVRDPRPTPAGATLATPTPTDAEGRTLHLGVFTADRTQVWVAGTVLRPIARVAVCDGALVLGYAPAVGSGEVVGAGVVRWAGYGFTTSATLPDLDGPLTPACADLDADGRLDPLVLEGHLP